jgi:branched-chain amino acid transport system ATP-binding protein
MANLKLDQISARFGGLQALSEVSFTVQAGEIVGLIGSNGAGKTTIFNVTTGVYGPSAGNVLLGDDSLLGRRPHQIFRMGIARTFQSIRLFLKMTAVENAMVAMHCRSTKGILGAILLTKSQKREEKYVQKKALEALAFVGAE